MKLFKYEMKKLLMNRTKMILLAIMFLFYGLLGFTFTLGNESEQKSDVAEYNSLVTANAGSLNQKQYEESRSKMQAAIAGYGTGEPLQYYLNRDPMLRFHFKYAAFGQSVYEYWNGPAEQDSGNIRGVYPLREKLSELEAQGKTDTYVYKLYRKKLLAEEATGEPVFENAGIWNVFAVMFDGILITLLLMMVFPFFISLLFTQEVKTDMDSIVLCSKMGRREIVTAKLLSAAVSSAVITLTYFLGTFTGAFIGIRDLSGFGVSARSIEGFRYCLMNISAGEAVLLGILWVIFVSVIFGLALSLVSSLLKNQAAAFGLGIVVLLSGIMSGMLPSHIKELLWLAVDFNFGALVQYMNIFSGTKFYNFFTEPISYGMASIVMCFIIAAISCLLVYFAQRKRSAS